MKLAAKQLIYVGLVALGYVMGAIAQNDDKVSAINDCPGRNGGLSIPPDMPRDAG
ncbi:hypothetical protein HG263_06740 [Pseudoalteromonas sp. JBTF-M23]|uniref:Uncharacterized protein n=1 Tax=Pseudoalteromonas caenipelagi TaxID=2726988 RepID=A0A849V9G6_9GAMM|nr:hypothetical protein [Pseudoalteromonas caenipelagi]NOU50239.1 hypothetical protein [Pseudoalteromonas caenipelagi]